MRHVIIEGPDGAGKTKLARVICRDHRMAYHHEGPPPADVPALEHYGRLLVEAERPTVFDRLHLGELVYGPLLRGGSRLSDYDAALLTRLVLGLGVTIVGCMPWWPTCRENCARKEELIKDVAMLERAFVSWQRLFASGSPFVNSQRWDYTTARRPFVLEQFTAMPDGVIGWPSARALLVGEQRNGTLDLPFFSARNSPAFLNGCLAEAGIRERDLALTNILDGAGRVRNVVPMVEQLADLEVVVALGKVAADHLAAQRLPRFVRVVNVPHPQFWKRFHNGSRGEYVDMLRKAVLRETA